MAANAWDLGGSALNAGASVYSSIAGSRRDKANRADENRQRELDRALKEKELAQQNAQFEKEFGLNKQGLSDTEAKQAALQEAFYQARSGAGTMAGQGEGALMSSLNTPSAQLEQQQKDLLTGQAAGMNQASGQMSADLAAQGVRGGQAAGALRRGIGEMGVQGQKDINAMKYQDEQQRQSQLRAYQQSKAMLGNQGTIQQASF